MVIIYINNFLFFGSDIKAIDKLKINLYTKFYIKNIKPAAYFQKYVSQETKKQKLLYYTRILMFARY
jgi:hypothetical protein